MTDILTSLLGRRKPKPPSPHNADDFVIVDASGTGSSPSSSTVSLNQQPAPAQHDYETLFSYLSVSQATTNVPVRAAPPVPPNAAVLPYPLHRASDEAPQQCSSGHYLTGIPFQLSKTLSDTLGLSADFGLNIRSPDLSEYEYGFTVEMQVLQESSPASA